MEKEYARFFSEKKAYVKRVEELLKDEKEVEKFIEFISKPLPLTVRANTLKITPQALTKRFEKKGWKVRQEKFYNHAFTILDKEESSIGNSSEHFLGYFYVQEIVSMLPAVVLTPELNSTVLDLCAAPGSKTTQISQLMENTGLIVANDVRIDRIRALVTNSQRCGCLNVLFTRNSGQSFYRKLKNQLFDYVFVDAPCSGESMFRKSWKYLFEWHESEIQNFSDLQYSIASSGLNSLKENGKMVYSTCTLSPEENELVIQRLLDTFNIELKKITINNFKTRAGITEFRNLKFSDEMKKCCRIYPHDNDTGAFFMALIEKK